MSHSIIPRAARPRVEGGSDQGGERWVLVRLQGADGLPVKELRWVTSGAFWIAPRKHAPAMLQLVTWDANGREVERKLSSGGRLCKGMLLRTEIYVVLVKEFGPVAARTLTTSLDLRYQTLLIEETPS